MRVSRDGEEKGPLQRDPVEKAHRHQFHKSGLYSSKKLENMLSFSGRVKENLIASHFMACFLSVTGSVRPKRLTSSWVITFNPVRLTVKLLASV
jgi:hypothetical protein